MRSIFRFVLCAMVLMVVGGCAFTGVRRELSPPPTFRYVNPQLQSLLHDVPVVIDHVDCVDSAMVNKRGIFGSVNFAGTFPLRQIAIREFGRFVHENMRSPLDGEAEKVLLKIFSKRVLVEQKWSRARAEMVFDVQMLDPKSEDSRPYFRGSFHGEFTSVNKDDSIVPEAVYKCIGQIVTDFTSALATDRTAQRRLAMIARPESRLIPPSLKAISFGDMHNSGSQQNGVVSGKCEVECNEWDGFEADKWARGQINSSCCMKLGVEPERVRVVYTSDDYDQKSKLWKYSFTAFVRAPMMMDYDPLTRSGVAVADLGLLNLSAEKAAAQMRDFVVREMRSRGGAVSTSAGLEDTLIRFREFKTDASSNLIQMGFDLPY